MFFLRCAFWLSVVYASMSWNDHRFAMPNLQAQALAASQGASQALTRHVASNCADRLKNCADDAMKLAALIATLEPQDAREAEVGKRVRDASRHP